MALRGLAGKVASITGGGSGIGEATARRLAAEQCHVAVIDIDGKRAETVATSLPGEAIAVAADVSSESDVDRFFKTTIDHFGRVDLVHNNAAIPGVVAPPIDTPLDCFDQVMAVNARGVFLGTQRAMRQFIRQGTGGAIVNTSAMAGLRGFRNLSVYVAAKHAVIGLTAVAAAEGAKSGVLVSAVCPGLVGHPF